MASKKNIELTALFGILCFSTLLIPSVNAESQVTIVSDTGYLDIIGYCHVVGEVKNTGSSSLKFVKVSATFYDTNNAVVAVDYGYTMLDILSAGTKLPFDVLLFDKTQSAKVDHFSLTTSYSSATDLPKGLTILSSSSYTDSIGILHVVGEVQNVGTSTSQFTELAATFYDTNGKVVGGDFSYSSPSDIQAGAKAPFDLTFIGASALSAPKSYTVLAQSNQYTDTATPNPSVNQISTSTSPTSTSTPTPTAPAETINTPTPSSTPTPQVTGVPLEVPTPSSNANVSPTPSIPEFRLATPILALFLVTALISIVIQKNQRNK